MRLRRVLVRNFRGVANVELADLGSSVVLPGQNGSGKSCILDAIKLIKSIYGPYQQNEFQLWFGEMQINFSGDPAALGTIFHDKSLAVAIEMDVEIDESEKRYLKENANQLIMLQAWRSVVPELFGWRSLDVAPFTAHFRAREPEVIARAKADRAVFDQEIDRDFITASINIEPGMQPTFNVSKVLELVLGTFDLAHFGIIDYHGPHRQYGREQLNAINVNLDALEEQRKQSTLYNYSAKYANVKSEMAGFYVREALAEKAGVSFGSSTSLTEALKELFVSFFPAKEFLGPMPTAEGGLRFPVKVGHNKVHDLDDLSSGEKEILFGYLRLRSSAPKNSVILLDEPELHLNPALTKNLPDFYYRHLAKGLGNQVWLITHSDAILRESVGKADFSVFHMTPSSQAISGENQAHAVKVDGDLEKAIVDLVGDLAAYRPGGRIIIFEGAESDFDLHMTSQLFPAVQTANLISGTNKTRVRGLHELLDKISEAGKSIAPHIYSITDRDTDVHISSGANRFSWNVYHIKNYLLEAVYISQVVADLSGDGRLPSAKFVEDELKNCAEETVNSLIIHEVTSRANKQLVSMLDLRINPEEKEISKSLADAIVNSRARVDNLILQSYSENNIEEFVQLESDRLREDLRSDAWKRSFRGRDVLKRFVGRHGAGLKYPNFRNLVIARMRDREFQPPGMKTVVDQILMPKVLGA